MNWGFARGKDVGRSGRAAQMLTRILEMEKARTTAERYTDRLPTFADWKPLSSDVSLSAPKPTPILRR